MQECPICAGKVYPQPRYPRYICQSCAAMAQSADGRPLQFSNVSHTPTRHVSAASSSSVSMLPCPPTSCLTSRGSRGRRSPSRQLRVAGRGQAVDGLPRGAPRAPHRLCGRQWRSRVTPSPRRVHDRPRARMFHRRQGPRAVAPSCEARRRRGRGFAGGPRVEGRYPSERRTGRDVQVAAGLDARAGDVSHDVCSRPGRAVAGGGELAHSDPWLDLACSGGSHRRGGGGAPGREACSAARPAAHCLWPLRRRPTRPSSSGPD